MNELATIEIVPTTALTLFDADLSAAHDFLIAEKSDATRRAYLSDFRIFSAYCSARGLTPLPAAADTVMAFLSAEANGGAKASTLGRRLAAIRYAHKAADLEPPTNSEAVKAVMRGIRRTIGTVSAPKSPATADLVRKMLDGCPDTTKGTRDRALLALGFAGAFRRSELVALRVEDLLETPDGFRVTICRSKTDQEGKGEEIAVLRGTKLRPVAAVLAWLDASGISSGPVFRAVGKGGRIGNVALSADAVPDIVKHHAQRVGLDPALFAAHSLRSGFLTTGAEAGASVFKLMEVSRHKSVDTLRGYVRRADLFRDHAGTGFL